MFTTGQAVSFGLNVLGKLGKKKPKKASVGAMMIGKKMIEDKMPMGGAAMQLRKRLMGRSKGGLADYYKDLM